MKNILDKVHGDIIFKVQNDVRCAISSVITKEFHNNPLSRVNIQKRLLLPIYEEVNEKFFRLSIRKINYEKR